MIKKEFSIAPEISKIGNKHTLYDQKLPDTFKFRPFDEYQEKYLTNSSLT